MKLVGELSINNNELLIGGVSANHLAQKYGTPLFVYDKKCIQNNIFAYTNALKKYYNNQSNNK